MLTVIVFIPSQLNCIEDHQGPSLKSLVWTRRRYSAVTVQNISISIKDPPWTTATAPAGELVDLFNANDYTYLTELLTLRNKDRTEFGSSRQPVVDLFYLLLLTELHLGGILALGTRHWCCCEAVFSFFWLTFFGRRLNKPRDISCGQKRHLKIKTLNQSCEALYCVTMDIRHLFWAILFEIPWSILHISTLTQDSQRQDTVWSVSLQTLCAGT